jgi:predicted ATPase/DNA-binding SARP family transcriptional activator
MAQLILRLMGRFEASIAGKPITAFETNKCKAMLAYLAAEADHVHTRDVLAGMLWPDSPQSSAMKSLRHALAALRKTIHDREAQPPYLLITHQTVQINRESDLQVDLWDFEQVSTHPSGISSSKAFIDQLESVTRLFGGPFLDGLSCGSDLFDGWVQIRREGLNRQFRETCSGLSLLYAERGEPEASIRAARKLLDVEPGDEAAHRLVMRGLARSGQRNAALAQYESCCQALRREYQVEPEPETRRLYEEIWSGRFDSETDLGPAASDLPPAGKLARPDLLAGWPALIGRERELAAIAARLDDPPCRLLTLVGPGGIGKTHLALAAAARQADRFSQGACFISLAAVQSVEAIPLAIAQELGFTFHTGEEPIQQLLDYLQNRELLLLLDNFEHLLEGANLVADILRAAAQVKIVVTSRTRLNLRGEYLFSVEGLEFPRIPQVKDLRSYAAVDLFLHGARRVQPQYEMAERDWKAIGQICKQVQGMPLALLLAASWMELLTPAEIAAEITRRSLEFLEAGWQDVPERQRSMRAVFDYSFRMLSPREQEIFAGLAVFRDGFTLAAAQAVTGAALGELRGLVDKSLVQRTSPGRCHLHELLRQYAQDALDRSPDLSEAAHDRHSAYFAVALAGWWKDFQGPRQFTVFDELGVDIENILAAWDWMVAHAQVQRLDRSFRGLFFALPSVYGDWMGGVVARQLCQQATDRLAPLVLPAPAQCCAGARLLVKLWVSLPTLLFQVDDQSIALLQQSEDLLRQLEGTDEDLRLEKVLVLIKKGELNLHLFNGEEARALYQECLALARTLQEPWMVARVLRDWGHALSLIGLYDEALTVLKECITISQRLGDTFNFGMAMNALRETTSYTQGDFEELEALGRDYFARCQGSDNMRVLLSAHGMLGMIYFVRGKFIEACAHIAECIAIDDQTGFAYESYVYDLFFSAAQIQLGQIVPAYAQCQTVLPFFRKSDQPVFLAYNLMQLGVASLGMENYAQAQGYLEESLLIEPKNWHHERGQMLAWLSLAERGLGNLARAICVLVQSLRIVKERRVLTILYYALPAAARILIDLGEVERALETYAVASRFLYVANSTWLEAAVGQVIAGRAADLPEETTAAARARGQARDLMSTVEELLAEFEKQVDTGAA